LSNVPTKRNHAHSDNSSSASTITNDSPARKRAARPPPRTTRKRAGLSGVHSPTVTPSRTNNVVLTPSSRPEHRRRADQYVEHDSPLHSPGGERPALDLQRPQNLRPRTLTDLFDTPNAALQTNRPSLSPDAPLNSLLPSSAAQATPAPITNTADSQALAASSASSAPAASSRPSAPPRRSISNRELRSLGIQDFPVAHGEDDIFSKAGVGSTILFPVSAFRSIVTKQLCSVCNGLLSMDSALRDCFRVTVKLRCRSCSKNFWFDNISCTLVPTPNATDHTVHQLWKTAHTLGALACGIGESETRRYLSTLGITPPSSRTYYRTSAALTKVIKEVTDRNISSNLRRCLSSHLDPSCTLPSCKRFVWTLFLRYLSEQSFFPSLKKKKKNQGPRWQPGNKKHQIKYNKVQVPQVSSVCLATFFTFCLFVFLSAFFFSPFFFFVCLLLRIPLCTKKKPHTL
jgi:hypothetical protein